MECLNPLFISLVDKASDGFTFEIYDYDNYLTKEEKRMKEENFLDKLIKAAKEEESYTENSEKTPDKKGKRTLMKNF